MLVVVSYRNSTSNHNRRCEDLPIHGVVSYRNSTSNHNWIWWLHCLVGLYLIEILHQTTTADRAARRSVSLYLIEILHQTTTFGSLVKNVQSCILSKFYIKPQPKAEREYNALSCIVRLCRIDFIKLYLIEILHQTTTVSRAPRPIFCCILSKFYIKPQPAEYEAVRTYGCILSKFYIKPQQVRQREASVRRCILSKFYIKPQQLPG